LDKTQAKKTVLQKVSKIEANPQFDFKEVSIEELKQELKKLNSIFKLL